MASPGYVAGTRTGTLHRLIRNLQQVNWGDRLFDRRSATGEGRRGDLAGADCALDCRSGRISTPSDGLQERKALEMFGQVNVEVSALWRI